MRLNWACTTRRRAKLGKQCGQQRQPLDKQTSSELGERGGNYRGGRGKKHAGSLGFQGAASSAAQGTQECGSGLVSQKEGGTGLQARFRKQGLGRERSGLCGESLGPQGNVSGRKRWKNEWREGEVSEEKAYRGRGSGG
jgi:hypothetical protein